MTEHREIGVASYPPHRSLIAVAVVIDGFRLVNAQRDTQTGIRNEAEEDIMARCMLFASRPVACPDMHI